MATHRLPVPGSDSGAWGDILNDFLLQAHSSDGTLAPNVVAVGNLQDGTITAAKLTRSVQSSLSAANSSVQSVNSKTPTSGAVTLVASDLGAPLKPAAGADGKPVKWNNTSGQLEDATTTLNSTYAPLAPNQRGAWAVTTAYAIGDYVIAPTGDIVTPKVAFTSAGSYDSSNWNVVVSVAALAGRELAAFTLATTLTAGTAITLTGIQSGNNDTSKDVQVTGFTVSPVVGTRSIYVEAEISWFTGVTGSFVFKLYDTTAGTVLDQDIHTGVTAFAGQPKARLAVRLSPAAGARTFAIKANGTAGALAINGSDQSSSSFIRVTER